MADSPLNGDVLITTERGRHLLRIVPHPHRLTVGEFGLAIQIAKKWAKINKVDVWRTDDGVATRVHLD